MNVNTVYLICDDILNKNQLGNLKPVRFNRLINQAQISFASYLLGTFQSFQQGQSRIQYSQSEIARQSLTPIIYGYTLNISASGRVNYPGDYEKGDAMWTIYGNETIRYTQQQNFASSVNSVIDPVDENPIFLIQDVGFQFYPTNLGQARLTYVKTPPAIVWDYTEDVNGLAVYNPTNSIDPVWNDIDMFEIIARLLRMMGVNLQAAQVSQFANEIKNTGQ